MLSKKSINVSKMLPYLAAFLICLRIPPHTIFDSKPYFVANNR